MLRREETTRTESCSQAIRWGSSVSDHIPILQNTSNKCFLNRALEEHPLALNEIDGALEPLSKSAQLELLKRNIKIYKFGWGLDFAHTAFSCKDDPAVGTVGDLTKHLKDVLKEVKKRRLTKPTEPPSIPSPVLSMPSLGTFTQDVATRRMNDKWSKQDLLQYPQEFKAALDNRKGHNEHDPISIIQPDNAPNLSTLCNHHIEVYLDMEREKDDGSGLEYFKWWCAGVITRISDGKITLGKGKRKKTMPANEYYEVNFDYGAVEWIKLKEDDFNCSRINGWRLDVDFEENKHYLRPALWFTGIQPFDCFDDSFVQHINLRGILDILANILACLGCLGSEISLEPDFIAKNRQNRQYQPHRLTC